MTDRESFANPVTAALVWARPPLSDWSATLSSLAAVRGLSSILFCGPGTNLAGIVPPGINVAIRHEYSLGQAVAHAFEGGIDQLMLVMAPAIFASGTLDYASEWMTEDLRIATVSFLTNSPGYLSFPHRNAAVTQHISGDTAESLTAKLRGSEAPHIGRVHIAVPEGPMTLISRAAFSAALGFKPEWDGDPEASVAEFALRATRRGFFTCFDPLTFVLRLIENPASKSVGLESDSRDRLHAEHPFFPALYDQQRGSHEGAFAITLDYARARYNGLRILIDGTCLGPHEMGTQLLTIRLVRALSEHPNVHWVGVALPGATLPTYAHDLLTQRGVRLYPNAGLKFTGADQADILHRLFQPDQPMPFAEWRHLAKRVVITIQDLIAYRVGAYHECPEDWLYYRHNLAQALRDADGTVAITQDTAQSIREERLVWSEERLIVAVNGTDHLLRDVQQRMPQFILDRNWAATPFALVLGTDYTHKNRDLAIRVFRQLRSRGYPLRLILAGASVPYGSSRQQESLAGILNDDLLIVPDVSTAERNWLLGHAAFVLYPTSAEGLGIVPFEAAALGTPTVSVSFGPLRELGDPDPAMSAENWDPDKLADIAQHFLDDPACAQEAVANTLKRGASLTWANTADKLVTAYFDLLSRPAKL